MPRSLRLQSAGFVHHIVSKGNDGQTLFQNDDDYRSYLSILDTARKQHPLKIYNFVLMPNHIHLLVEPEAEGAMSKVMQLVSKNYAKYFNKKYDRSGHVFQGRFKSFLVQEEKYFFACSRYIDLNPVKANLVESAKDYPWSGYATLAHAKKSPIALDIHAQYEHLGTQSAERQIGYRALVSYHQGEDLDLMQQRAGVLGDRAFKKRMKEQAQENKL